MYDKIFLQGGGKLLVVISWNDNNSHNSGSAHNCDENGDCQRIKLESGSSLYSHYEILFNGVPVPTTEIQPGVLRCLLPGKNLYKYLTYFYAFYLTRIY